MSTLAIGGSSAAPAAGRRTPLIHADLVLLALALPLFVALDWPLLGYVIGAVAWVAQRLAMGYAERRTVASLSRGDRRDAFRTTAISTLGRVWLVSFAVLAVGLLADRADGLAAALLVTALFTVQLAVLALTRGRSGAPR